jgi:flagellar hook-associated protein 2
MAISSTGVGSGLDVKSIVSQLVAIEKQALKPLQVKASSFQTQLSLYGTIKSQASALGDAAALLAGASGWNAQKASSSNSSAVGVTAGSTAVAASLSVEVQQLARAQTSASSAVPAGVAVGAAGDLSIEFGSWSKATPPAFTTDVTITPIPPITISAGDTVSAIAAKINAAKAGVTATVLRDGANERLVIRSSTTGEAAGFRLNFPADAGLAAFGFTNPSDALFVGQKALNAEVKINGVDVVSASNKMENVIPGVTLQLSQVTTAPVEVTVETDVDAIKKNIQGFVDSYNALNKTLADSTLYSAATKSAGPLQADSTTIALQNALRAIVSSSSVGATFTLGASSSRLFEAGIERQTDGSLKLKEPKYANALEDLSNLKKLFATDNNNATTNGFGLKVRDFARGLVASDGSVSNKSKALQGSISRNSKDQDRVNERALRVEAQLNRQYSALDAQMAQLNGLNSYITSQLAQWNKSSG